MHRFLKITQDVLDTRASAEKFPRREDNGKKRSKTSSIKPPSALLVSCMKIQEGTPPPVPRYRRPWLAFPSIVLRVIIKFALLCWLHCILFYYCLF